MKNAELRNQTCYKNFKKFTIKLIQIQEKIPCKNSIFYCTARYITQDILQNKEFEMKLLLLICLVSLPLLVSCGGGSSASSSTNSMGNNSTPTVSSASSISSSASNSSISNSLLTEVGGIADIWPSGLHYETTSGIKGEVYIGDSNDPLGYPRPHFYFGERDDVVFNIGNLKLPSTLATRSVTLFDIFKTHQVTNEMTNYLRLLLTIGANSNSISQGGSAHNPLRIPNKYNDTLLNIYITLDDLKLPPNDFELSVNVQNFINKFEKGSTLVSVQAAHSYFNKTMATARLPCFYIDPTYGNASGYYGSRCEDSDGDGILDKNDAFPWDADEFVDSNGDGVGDNQNRTYTDLSVPNANKFAFNNKLGQLYIYHKTSKFISVIDLQSGVLLETLSIDHQLKCMTLSVDGKLLYIALSKNVSNSNLNDSESNSIAVVDTATFQQISSFNIDIDPFDLAIVDDDRLLISSGSGTWIAPKLYDTKSGNFLSSLSGKTISAKSALLYDQERKILHLSNSLEIYKYEFNSFSLEPTIDSPVRTSNDNSNRQWLTPGANFIVANTGSVYSNQSLFIKNILPYGITDIVFDTEVNQAYAIEGGQYISYFNLTTFEKSGQVGFNKYGGYADQQIMSGFDTDYSKLDTIYAYKNYLYIIHIKMGGSLQLIKIPKPCLYCHQSIPPETILSVSTSKPNIFNSIILDASSSNDTEDGTNLLYRWDMNSDGVWDSSFTSNSVLQYKWITSGEKTVTVQVKDSSGNVSSTTQKIAVTTGSYKGTEPKSKIFSDLGIPITYVLQDKERGKAYVTSMYNNKMYIVDLISGFVEREFEFENEPSKMVMTPDNRTVYMSLVMGNNSTQWDRKDQRGAVLKFDPEQQAFVDGFDIKIDPYDMILNDLGQLAITHGSGQHGVFHLYEPNSGRFIAEFGGGYQQQRFMIATQDVLHYSYPDSRFEITAYDGIYYMLMDDIYFNGDRSWVMPDGKNINFGKSIMSAADQEIVAELDGYSLGKISFDADQNLMFQLTREGDIHYFNSTTYEFLGSISSIKNAAWVVPQGDKINVFSQTSNFVSALTQLPHPCTVCGNSTDPIASFNFSQTTADTATQVQIDASTSYDMEDESSKLQYIWDFDDDGVWDTAYSFDSTMNYRFRMLGAHPVKLKVKDSSGKISIATKTINITSASSDAGEKLTSTMPYRYDFKATDAIVDQSSGVVYISDKEQKRIYIVNLTTGIAEKYFDFFYRPEKLTISPDGKKLYAAITLKENNSWLPPDNFGYVTPYGFIAVIDLQQQAIVNYFKVNSHPMNLAAANNNQLIISSKEVHLVNSNTGIELDSFNNSDATYSPLQFNPVNNTLFLTPGFYNSQILKVDTSEDKFNFISKSNIPGEYNIGQNLWLTPDGNYIITRGGDVFDSNSFNFISRLTENGEFIAKLTFDKTTNRIIIITENQRGIKVYSLLNWSLLQTFSDNMNAQFVLPYKTKGYIVNWDNEKLIFKELQ